MKYPHLHAKLFNTPLALHRPVIASFQHYLINGQSADIDIEKHEDEDVSDRIGNVAIISISGVIDKHMSMMDAMCYGGCDLARIDQELIEVANDPTITHVVLHINSPGGGVIGTPETAARIAALRETKEVHAFVDKLAASAGYWLASQADVIAATPSAIIGSIGVYTVALDLSAAYQKNGVNVQMIKAGEYKDTGSSHRPLSEDELTMLQADVDQIHNDFKSAVTTLRDVLDSDMEGQVYTGAEAQEKKLIDVLTILNLDEYVSTLLG